MNYIKCDYIYMSCVFSLIIYICCWADWKLLRYNIVASNADRRFRINSSTGAITISTSLNNHNESRFAIFTVSATYSAATASSAAATVSNLTLYAQVALSVLAYLSLRSADCTFPVW